jgi:hypothetical protein
VVANAGRQGRHLYGGLVEGAVHSDREKKAMSAQLFQIEEAGNLGSKSLFFAYGTNMHLAQIKQRCSHPVYVAAAFLADYRIGFYGHSAEWDGALETAVRQPGSRLWGVVYALNDLDWDQLDQWMDARFDGTGKRFHYPVQVCDLRGNRYEARMYKLDVLGPACPPNEHYIEGILAGARANQLPPAYIDNLLSIETTTAHYAVPRHTGYDPSAASGDACSSCDSTY